MTAETAPDSRPSFALHLLLALYATLLVASVAGGSKVIGIGPFTAAATVFSYGLTFLITDIISEVWGERQARRFVMLGFLSMIVAVGFFQLAMRVPPAPIYQGQADYEAVFSVTWRFLLGGLTAYLVSQYLDVLIFARLKAATGGRFLWLRNNGSTLVSQAVDTLIFITIAFYGQVDALLPLYAGQYLVKLMIAGLDTVLIYPAVALLRAFLAEKRTS